MQKRLNLFPATLIFARVKFNDIRSCTRNTFLPFACADYKWDVSRDVCLCCLISEYSPEKLPRVPSSAADGSFSPTRRASLVLLSLGQAAPHPGVPRPSPVWSCCGQCGSGIAPCLSISSQQGAQCQQGLQDKQGIPASLPQQPKSCWSCVQVLLGSHPCPSSSQDPRAPFCPEQGAGVSPSLTCSQVSAAPGLWAQQSCSGSPRAKGVKVWAEWPSRRAGSFLQTTKETGF